MRGLKYLWPRFLKFAPPVVAPFMGAWIEIMENKAIEDGFKVAPYMGAWIEILITSSSSLSPLVAPYMGAWIEISTPNRLLLDSYCRTLHGCVD